jgi:hypothetical protein
MPTQKPVAPRSYAMLGNRGEIILNPNIAATEDIKFLYIQLSAKLDTFRIINKKTFWQ